MNLKEAYNDYITSTRVLGLRTVAVFIGCLIILSFFLSAGWNWIIGAMIGVIFYGVIFYSVSGHDSKDQMKTILGGEGRIVLRNGYDAVEQDDVYQSEVGYPKYKLICKLEENYRTKTINHEKRYVNEFGETIIENKGKKETTQEKDRTVTITISSPSSNSSTIRFVIQLCQPWCVKHNVLE